MKKFTKGMLIAAGIFGAVGIGLTAAGGVMGASMSELTGVESLKRVLLVADGDYDYDDSDDYDDDDDYDDSDDYDRDFAWLIPQSRAWQSARRYWKISICLRMTSKTLLMRMRKMALYIS